MTNVWREDQVQAAEAEARAEAQEASRLMASKGWELTDFSTENGIATTILQELKDEQYRVCAHADKIAPAYSYIGWKVPEDLEDWPRGSDPAGTWPVMCKLCYNTHMDSYTQMLLQLEDGGSVCTWCGEVRPGMQFYSVMFVIGFINFNGRVCEECVEESQR